MIRYLLFVLSLSVFVAVAPINVDAGQHPGPEKILLKNGSNPLAFTHRKHQNLQNSECFHCHKPDIWKIDDWGKEVAHSMCISCHDLSDKGPVKCEDCHK